MTTPPDASTLRTRTSKLIMRVGRAVFRNTPIQRLPFMSAVYRKLVRSAYGDAGTTVVQFRGIEIEIATGDITTLPTLADGSYESTELDRFLGLVPQGAVVADIGANIGIWSVLLSRAVGAGGRVFAFEPSPANATLLASNLLRNGCTNVEIVSAAVGRAAGHASLDTTTAGATHRLASGTGKGDTPVDVVSLDEFAVSAQVHIDAVKIDVEGHEPEVLAGMTTVLAGRPLLLAEFSMPQAAAAGTSWAEPLGRLLDSYGSCEVFDGRTTQVVKARGTSALLESNKLLNLLFTPLAP